jgi:hypothetical protein
VLRVPSADPTPRLQPSEATGEPSITKNPRGAAPAIDRLSPQPPGHKPPPLSVAPAKVEADRTPTQGAPAGSGPPPLVPEVAHAALIASLREAPPDGGLGPRRLLLLICEASKPPLEDADWAAVHNRLRSVAAARGLAAVRAEYGDLIRLFEAHWGAFRASEALRTFSEVHDDIPVFDPEYVSTVVHAFDSARHEVIVFGADDGTRERFARSGVDPRVVYGVNVLLAGTPGVDLVADMNSAAELSSLPSHACRELCAEYVPAHLYHNASFFRNARRLLRAEGLLVMNASAQLQQAPWSIEDLPAFFRKHGFEPVDARADSRACIDGEAWVLRPLRDVAPLL